MRILPVNNMFVGKNILFLSERDKKKHSSGNITDVFVKSIETQPEPINTRGFITQEIYEEFFKNPDQEWSKEELKIILDRMDLKEFEKLIGYGDMVYIRKIIEIAKSALSVADIPLTESNRAVYQKMLDKFRLTKGMTLNIMDKNGCTILEKVMRTENDLYLNTIKAITEKEDVFSHKGPIIYEPKQKQAFERIKNAEFKEKCRDLLVKFYDIIDDIEKCDMLSLEKHIKEQMSCGFCNLQYAIEHSLYRPAVLAHSEGYAKKILIIAEKYYPKEIGKFLQTLK